MQYIPVIGPAYRALWIEQHRRVCRGESLSWQFEIVGLKGTLRYMETHAVPLPNPDGTFSQLAVTRDITQNKRAEEALRLAREDSEKQKRLYEAVTGSTPDLIYVFDLQYRFIYANEALLKMWGLTWAESAGKLLLEVGYEPWHAEMHEREIDQVVATKKSIRGEVSFPHAVLGRRVYDYIFVPVLDERGEVEAVAGTTRDITELKQAEAALEQRVAERTRELNQANAALQQSNEDLLQFAHVASHDLKEPVRKIMTFTHRLQDEISGVSEQARVYLEKIQASGARMAMMIDGVLAYSSMNSESRQNESVDLNAVLQDIASDLEVVIQQKQATLTVHDLPLIEGNRFLLYQLFYNLVNNAFKFARAGVPSVVTLSGVAQGDFVRITVQDNGIGFEQAHAEKIFEAFCASTPKTAMREPAWDYRCAVRSSSATTAPFRPWEPQGRALPSPSNCLRDNHRNGLLNRLTGIFH